jgi:ketosteroid isomerase-like protein
MLAQWGSTEVRMLSTRAVVLVGLIAISSTACAGSTANDQGIQGARAAIEAANAKFSEAFARGDANALSAMYTSDAIAFPPDSEMIRGSGAIGEFWKAQRDGGVQSAALTTIDVGMSGDVAYEVGNVSLMIQSSGREPTPAMAKYVVVWKRQVDGSWKLHRDIWNSLPATK